MEPILTRYSGRVNKSFKHSENLSKESSFRTDSSMRDYDSFANDPE